MYNFRHNIISREWGSRSATNTQTYYQSTSSDNSYSGITSEITGESSGSSDLLNTSGSSQGVQATEIRAPAVSATETRIPGMLYSCPGTLPQQFRKMSVIVCTEEDRLIVRNHATSGGEEFRIYHGTVVTVLSGPECDGISSWWKIRVDNWYASIQRANRTHFYLDHDVDG